MKKALFSLFSVCCLLAAARPATTQTTSLPQPSPRTEGIRQDVASGQLTRPEVACLRAREADTYLDKVAAHTDGVVTHDKHQDIRQNTRQTSHAVYRQKHNGQVGPRLAH